MGSENFGKMAGNIVATKIPEFLEALANTLNQSPEPDIWYLENDTQSGIHGTYKSI